jgi:hypothetical protein
MVKNIIGEYKEPNKGSAKVETSTGNAEGSDRLQDLQNRLKLAKILKQVLYKNFEKHQQYMKDEFLVEWSPQPSAREGAATWKPQEKKKSAKEIIEYRQLQEDRKKWVEEDRERTAAHRREVEAERVERVEDKRKRKAERAQIRAERVERRAARAEAKAVAEAERAQRRAARAARAEAEARERTAAHRLEVKAERVERVEAEEEAAEEAEADGVSEEGVEVEEEGEVEEGGEVEEEEEEPQKVIERIKRESSDGKYYQVVYKKDGTGYRPKREYLSKEMVPNDIVKEFIQKR